MTGDCSKANHQIPANQPASATAESTPGRDPALLAGTRTTGRRDLPAVCGAVTATKALAGLGLAIAKSPVSRRGQAARPKTHDAHEKGGNYGTINAAQKHACQCSGASNSTVRQRQAV